MICSFLELWIVVIGVADTYRECGLRNVSHVRCRNSQLIFLPILVIQWLLQYDFSAELIDGEVRCDDVIAVVVFGAVLARGHEAVCDGGICVNVIR